MSQYEQRRRSNVLSGDGSRLPNGGNTRVGQRGSGHLAAFSVCLGGRLDKTGTHAIDGPRGEAVGKPSVARVYTNQRLNLSKPWEGTRRTCQGLEPDPGNLAVRDFRGASRNVRHGETVNPPAIERAGSETPHLQQAALDLYPNRSASCEARSAPRSYPTGGGRPPPATRWARSNPRPYRDRTTFSSISSVAVGANSYAHTGSAEANTTTVVITPALDITLTRGVSVRIIGLPDDDTAFTTFAPATAIFIADHANVLNVALRCD